MGFLAFDYFWWNPRWSPRASLKNRWWRKRGTKLVGDNFFPRLYSMTRSLQMLWEQSQQGLFTPWPLSWKSASLLWPPSLCFSLPGFCIVWCALGWAPVSSGCYRPWEVEVWYQISHWTSAYCPHGTDDLERVHPVKGLGSLPFIFLFLGVILII